MFNPHPSLWNYVLKSSYSVVETQKMGPILYGGAVVDMAHVCFDPYDV